MLEDAITVPEYKNTLIMAEQSDYLGQAYQLSGQSELNMRYERTTDDLNKTVNASKKQSDKKQKVKDIISKGIKEHRSNLVQVKDYIEERLHRSSLSSIDNAYIERKYIKYCANFWLKETKKILKELTKSKSRTVIQEIFNSLDDIESLSQIPNPLNQAECYILLMKHYELIKVRKEAEKIFISLFKKECLKQIVAYSDSAEKELVFLETFVDFLSSSRNLKSIISELELGDFCRDKLSFNELLEGIMKLEVNTHGASLIALQEVAKYLQQEEELFLIDKFKEVVGVYIKPVKIQERKVDGRLVVEVTGKNIVISEIVVQLKNKLFNNTNVEEVRFVGEIIHIDTNLKRKVWYGRINEINRQQKNTLSGNSNIVHFDVDSIHIDSKVWQGRNVVILTKVLKVHNQVIWDVSGKDNDHTYSDNAGTGEDGHGKQGADGYPGESGGNVLVLVEKIENPENFIIISNGGKGSKGQDGGNGKRGEDGKSITEAEFKEKFPPAAKYTHVDRANNILKTVNNIKKDLQHIITEWYESPRNAFPFSRDVIFNKNVIEEVIKDCENTKRGRNTGVRGGSNVVPFEGNIFINAMLYQGNEVIFSFERGGITSNCQAFLLYKGSSGHSGGQGGEYGLGGQGGYAGEITVKNLESSQEFNTIKEVKQGKEGEKGQGGLYGDHGENGWDMGYMDYSVSKFFSDEWPKFPGVKEKSKIELKYYSDNSPKRIRCPYEERKGKGDIYAEMKPFKFEHKKQKRYEERKCTRQNSERQHHAQAVRKKHISQSNILADYSHHLTSLERSALQNLRSDLENSKQLALQAIVENQEQQENQTTELRIKRHAKSTYQGKSKHYIVVAPSIAYSETIDVEDLINKLKNNPSLLDHWFQLKKTELSLSKLNQLFSIFETLKDNSTEVEGSLSDIDNTKVQDIEKLLIDKYRLATLQKIAKHLLPSQEVADNVELTPENAPRYLVEVKDNEKNVSHPVLGTLDQYFYEKNEQQRNKISTFCKEELQNSTENSEILKRSLKMFILEIGKLEEAHTDVKTYYNENEEFLKKQELTLNIFFEAVSQPRHAEIFDLWIESIKDKFLISKLEEKIQKDVFLKVLYNRFNNQFKLEYDWDKCSKDPTILKEYNDHIQEKGPLSESYRELLAYIFDINIRLYAKNLNNKLFLKGDHNPSSKQIIHILCRDNRFIQLNIDKNYLKLEEDRKKKDNLYAHIFAEIKSFKQKQEFDDYLKNKAFLSSNSPLGDKKSFNEKEDIDKIIEYFPEEERQQLKGRLYKITTQYIGRQGILHAMLKHFSIEGRHVSSQELYYFINSILTSVVKDKKELNIFCWIVAAYPQKSWIDELILLQLEDYFKKTLTEKPELRNYLSKIENKGILLLFQVKLDQQKSSSPISTQCIEDTLRLLSNIPNETINLEGLGLSEWPYALKEKYWTCRLSKLLNWKKSELPTSSYYILSMENIFGNLLAEIFIEILEKKKHDLSLDTLTKILSNFHHEKWNLSEEELKTLRNCNISEWVKKMEQKFTADEKERNVTQLIGLIKGNANTSKGIFDKLPDIEDSVKSISDEKYVIGGKTVGSFTEDDIKNWTISGRKQSEETHKEMLAVIDRGIELKRGFKLRDTQKLTVLALLTNNRSTLAQVSTGEGKSLIVVAASVIKALCGEKVDIITSSSVLAKRDAEDNRDIYSLFDINVSHNCSEDIEKRKEAYSGNQVVYGDLSNFQRDYLLDKFYGKNILGDRNFENVIVDEVDSMLLDKGNNMLYLSYDLAGLDKLESVYIYIWMWINRPARDCKELSYVFDTNAIKEAVINDLYGLVKKEDIGKLGSELSEQNKNIIWERLVKAEILDHQGKLLKESIAVIELNKVLLSEFDSYKDRLSYLLKECIERDKFIHVPNHLRPFIEQHLESWINSAKTAFFMKTGENYVVDVDKTGTSPDRNPNITILDTDTGTDQANSQWDEALHQFLQLKHGCKLSLQSLKGVLISNVSFFKLYSNLYGLTGTLGSQRERDLLREIYKVDFVTIPTAKSKQFHEDKPILCSGKEEWINHIRYEVTKLTKELTEEKKRSVLIICETVNDVEVLCKAFGGKDAKHVHTYMRDYEKFNIAQGLEQGQIIIATNLAGRGTDIKITERLRKAGGLHVCLTYLPNNIRVEQQALGRAARSGDQGSGQLIIMDSKGHEYSNSKILDLKKERDAEELNRISDIKTYYETQITMEESCFKAFKEQYEQLKKDLDDKRVPTEVKEILMQSCLDKWAFWLDEHGKWIENVTDEQSKRNFNSLLGKFISRLKNLNSGFSEKWSTSYDDGPPIQVIEHDSKSWLPWVEGNPAQMIKLGKYLSQNRKHKNAPENAMKLFNEVIEKEPYFSQAAHYYKAFALTKKINWEQKPLEGENKKALKEVKKELREAARRLDEHSKFALNAAGIIGKIKKSNNESIIQIDAYEEQQKSFANLYYMFSRSIDDTLGHTITPQSFVNHDIKEELAKVLYKDLLREGILKKPSVKKNISKEELKRISSGYGVSIEALKDFLYMHKGKQINEKEFHKALKKSIPLPSRETFWKLLTQEKVLSQEVKYVVVDNERLREIDPSLLDFLIEQVDKKKLKKQTLESNNEQIFFNAEWITQQKNNGNVFEKDDFIQTVGKNKYQVLKDNVVLSFNRKARIDLSRIICTSYVKSTTFSYYGSITLEDFSKINISKSEAEKILVELIDEKVVEKRDCSENSVYGLKIKFDEIKQVKLRSYSVYENAVKGLLSVCFTYTIALQKIAVQLEEKNFPICLQLMTKPHQNLVLELLEQKIIRPTTVTKENEDFKRRLKNMYSRTMTKENFKLMLSQDNLIQEECTEKLFNCLIEKKWIVKYNPIQSIQDEGIGKQSIKNAGKSLVQDLYYINSPNKRQTPLSFSLEGNRKNILTKSQSIDKTVEKVLDNRLQLIKEETIKNVIRNLGQSRSSLKSLKVPDGALKPLTEACEFANIEEIYVFSLNGLDQFLQLEEKKWTKEMLLNTAVVTAMGISQIAIGTAIELYSAGVMTHVGAAFVNEGVNDLFFAAGALKSGHFSWEDYSQHKLESLMMTAATAGIGAYLSRGTKINRFGHKLAGPSFEIGGKKVAEMSGTQLIKTAGSKVVGKEVTKRITLKAMEGVVFGLANAGVDTLVENYLQGLCNCIASSILSNIEQKVEKHNIFTSLKEVYETLGEEKAKKMVNDLTQSTFTEKKSVEELLPIANKIVSSVTQGIAKAVEKRGTTSNKLVFPIHNISKVVVWQERVAHIAHITTITGKLLDDLDIKIQNKSNSKELKQNAGLKNQKQEAEKSYESFKKELIDQWKLLLCEKAGRVIAQHIVSPILKESANHLVRYIGKKVKEEYKSFKESEYIEHFEELKQKYQEGSLYASEQQHDITSQTESHITEKYHKDLLKLMTKTKNTKLFTAIIRENIPMDMTCVSACTKVIHKVLEKQGIRGLTIIVEGEGGIRQKFSSVPEGVAGLTIKLELKDNHFQIHGNSIVKNNRNSESKNNCLFEALSEQICLNMTPENFRATIAKHIEQDPEIHYHIRKGWHQLPISLGAFGGDRAYDEKIPANQLSEKIIDGKILFSQSSIGDHTSDKGGRKKMHIGELAEEIKKHGWKGKPIKAVKKGDKLVVLDHRRTVAVATTQSHEVEANFAVYGPEDEFSSESCERQYGTRKAGEAVEKRMRRGSLPDFSGIGFASSDVRIRTTRLNDNPDTKLTDATSEKLEEMKFQVGGPSRKTRSKSSDRFSTTQRGSRYI